jgi:hypothetical protein
MAGVAHGLLRRTNRITNAIMINGPMAVMPVIDHGQNGAGCAPVWRWQEKPNVWPARWH